MEGILYACGVLFLVSVKINTKQKFESKLLIIYIKWEKTVHLDLIVQASTLCLNYEVLS
jgi:hypothetical protein